MPPDTEGRMAETRRGCLPELCARLHISTFLDRVFLTRGLSNRYVQVAKTRWKTFYVTQNRTARSKTTVHLDHGCKFVENKEDVIYSEGIFTLCEELAPNYDESVKNSERFAKERKLCEDCRRRGGYIPHIVTSDKPVCRKQ